MTRQELIQKELAVRGRRIAESDKLLAILKNLPDGISYEHVTIHAHKATAGVRLKANWENVHDTLIMLSSLIPPQTLNVYKAGSTSIFPDLCLTPAEVSRINEGRAELTPIFPFYFQLEFGRPSFEWFTVIDWIGVVHVELRLPFDIRYVRTYREVVVTEAERRSMHPNDPRRNASPKWKLEHKFKGACNVIRWAGGDAGIANKFTITWYPPTTLKEVFSGFAEE